jgi:tetratricopeptide (TPR) repeat protein
MAPLNLDAFERIVRQNAHAETAARAALATAGDPAVLRGVAQLYDGMGQYERALQVADRAVAMDAGAESHFQRAIVLQHLGRFGDALTAYRRTVTIEPLIARAHLEIVQLSAPEEAQALAPKLRVLFEQVRAHPIRAMFVGHALARIAEDAGDFAGSFVWLQRAKALLNEQQHYDHAAARAVHNVAQPLKAGRGFASEEPIFVVGLPRTGTTLLERILSSHPSAISAGELSQLLLLTNAMAGAAEPARRLDADALVRAKDFDFARFGAGYVESTRPFTGSAPRFVDKAPMNYLLAGVAHAALPDARIICLRRDPVDACLSIYRQVLPVRTGQYDFAYDLENAARHVVLFEQLLARWRAELPAERFTVLSYEKLVAGFEGEVHRLLDFCGLPWDARCLNFHENAGPVATPSATQVRRPLYSASVGRWRRYEPLMQPALRILHDGGLV